MKKLPWNPYLALLAGIALAGVLTSVFTPSEEPVDSFDSPQMALAELQKTLDKIAMKVNTGMDVVSAGMDLMNMSDEEFEAEVPTDFYGIQGE